MSDEEESDDEPVRKRRARLPAFAILASDFWNNRKIRKAGRNGRDVFLFALTCNASRGRTGSIPAGDLDAWYLSDQLKIPEADASSGLVAAIEARLLARDGDRIVICGWDETWSRVDETSARTERRRAQAEKQKQIRESERESEESRVENSSPAIPGQSPDSVRTLTRATPPSTEQVTQAPARPPVPWRPAWHERVVDRVYAYARSEHHSAASKLGRPNTPTWGPQVGKSTKDDMLACLDELESQGFVSEVEAESRMRHRIDVAIAEALRPGGHGLAYLTNRHLWRLDIGQFQRAQDTDVATAAQPRSNGGAGAGPPTRREKPRKIPVLNSSQRNRDPEDTSQP